MKLITKFTTALVALSLSSTLAFANESDKDKNNDKNKTSIDTKAESDPKPETETQTETVQFECEQFATDIENGTPHPELGKVSFQAPHPMKNKDLKNWTKKITLVAPKQANEKPESITLDLTAGHNRGAISRVGTWKFWKWGEGVQVYSDAYPDPKKSKQYPNYYIHVIAADEPSYVFRELNENEAYVAVCKIQ